MTMAYMIRDSYLAALAGVMNVEGWCRPQNVRDDGGDPFFGAPS